LKPDLGLKAKFTEGVTIGATAVQANKKCCVQVQLQVHGLSHRQ